MTQDDNRRHPREPVAMAAIVSPGRALPVMGVIDLSEGGACVEWTLPDDVPVGTPVRVCFLLDGTAVAELDGRFVRAGVGRAGIEFDAAQRDALRQLMAESRWDD